MLKTNCILILNLSVFVISRAKRDPPNRLGLDFGIYNNYVCIRTYVSKTHARVSDLR